jgi:hypothetical protein
MLQGVATKYDMSDEQFLIYWLFVDVFNISNFFV